VEHEATTSRRSATTSCSTCAARPVRGGRVNLIVNGFCKEVFKELPMEFAVEAQKLLAVSLEGAVG
jgi:Fe-S cluster assembly protein SufB